MGSSYSLNGRDPTIILIIIRKLMIVGLRCDSLFGIAQLSQNFAVVGENI